MLLQSGYEIQGSAETNRLHTGGQLNSYLLTDNTAAIGGGRAGDIDMEGGAAVLSQSNDGFLLNSISNMNGHMAANAYTLGNIRGDDHQVTLPSIT